MEFKDKFIGFIDILGFERLVENAECGHGKTLAEIQAALDSLGAHGDIDAIRRYGPSVCPDAPKNCKDVDFQLTQVSDCVIVSTEVSVAGLISVVNHCWTVVLRLLNLGLMCRGHIRRGLIAHEGSRFIGTGYQEAIKREKNVSAFSRYPDDTGTPFVEIDQSVLEYVDACGNSCVREMFDRLVLRTEESCAIFPFKRISTSFIIGTNFDSDEEKRNNEVVRGWLMKMKSDLDLYLDRGHARAVQKAEHYEAALKQQLEECDKVDEMIDLWNSPAPRDRTIKLL